MELKGKYWIERTPQGQPVFQIGDRRFLIRQRKGVGEKKPEQFLIQVSPQFCYVSSLYPAGGEGRFTIDCQGKMYRLVLQEDSVEITGN